MSDYVVRILLIDDDEKFRNSFLMEMKKQSNDILYQVQCINPGDDIKFEYDMYVCDHKGNGCSISNELIKNIRKKDQGAVIFVSSDHKDFNLMKNLVNSNLDGFIEKYPLNVSAIINEAKVVLDTHQKVQNMVKKLQRLRMLKSAR